MNEDVKAKAQALADALAESEEFKAFTRAREELEQHEAAKIMLRDFQRKQLALQQKVMQGQTPTEAEMQKLQEAYQLVLFNPYVRKVVEAEAAFSEMLAEVQKILGEAIGLPTPDDEGAAGSSPAASDAGSDRSRRDDGGSARSRLWVPGRP